MQSLLAQLDVVVYMNCICNYCNDYCQNDNCCHHNSIFLSLIFFEPFHIRLS